MRKALFALPFVALALIAAKDSPPAAPTLSVVPPAAIAADPANKLTLELSTGGKVVILLRPDAAPNHVQRIQQLVQRGFYNGTVFHRVIPGFMAQGGDPKGTGEGGSELPDLKAEFNSLPHLRGTMAMARADNPDSANSQFYIAFGPKVALDKNYTVLGRVIAGMDAVDKIAVGEPPAEPTRIVRASLEAAPAVAAVPAAAEPAQPETVPAPTGG
jgi:cyclophilin family peptidyl-prolyl cis-trans isomerase